MLKKVSLFIGLLLLFSIGLNAQIVKKCDSFIFLVDETSSMNVPYNDSLKIDLEKKLLEKINKNIPETNYTASLKTFGSSGNDEKSFTTKSLFNVSKYDKEIFGNAISKVQGSISWTPLGYALESVESDISNMNGKIHIVVFSDGKENASYTKAEDIAAKIHSTYNNVCIFTVQIGDSDEGKEVLEKIAENSKCGKFFSGDELFEDDGLKDFITEVFGYKKIISKTKTPLDSDNDGVYDCKDKCPNTPKNAPVDSEGCWQIGKVYFDYNKYNIKPEYEPVLNEILEVLLANPNIKLIIKGYTDSRGTSKYNIKLSKNRAKTIYNFFKNHKIDNNRLIIKYFGEEYPASTNANEQGRALNRRVEFEIIK